MKKANNIKKNKIKCNRKIISIALILVLLASCIITIRTAILQRKIKEIASKPIIEYEVKNKISYGKYEILVKINSVEGIETIKYKKENDEVIQLNSYGKMQVAIDYNVEDKNTYEFKIKLKGKEEKIEQLYFETPRIQGIYSLDDGIYVDKPDVSGYNENYTRYVNITEDGFLEPGNWINNQEPSNWYNYKNQQWANIYVEASGMETNYVWIPRYCFKLDQENERSDVKFIDVYDNYKDENGNITTWSELSSQGYQIPEAFEFGFTQIPGYWAMKYTVGDRNEYTIDYDGLASKSKIYIKSISNSSGQNVEKYTIAINGTIVENSNNGSNYEYTINTEGVNIVNVTALDSNGEIIGSMTKEVTQAKVNAPDLTAFNQDTTFYVTYDENGNEHSTIPISSETPVDWYDYVEQNWANIVTRNNGLETYYVWIPRYEFSLDQNAQRSRINFLEGTATQTSSSLYQIPEAFTFDGKELKGFWSMKYTVGEEFAPQFDTEVVATSSSIKTKGITGTEVESGQKYNYYINGEYKGSKTTASDTFEFSGLEQNTDYTILVEIRTNNSADEYIGTIVKQISTIDANKPELGGFNTIEIDSSGNKLPVTYYVLYDQDGNETIGSKVKNDGSNMPSNWYNYSESRWANIVVTNGTIENGQIQNATMTTYYTWIPRYEFMIPSSQQKQPASGRIEVRFLSGITTETDVGYQIPEAFTFGGKQLKGYWTTKYTIGE